MSDSSSDSEPEEVNDLLKEAANCDYVNKLYSNEYFEVKENHLNTETTCANLEEETINSHQVFLAKKLTKRLDKLIKLTNNVVEIDPSIHRRNVNCGIKLLSDSVCIDVVEEDELKSTLSRPLLNSLTEDDYNSRATEAAVSSEWVQSGANTAFWKFYKPKIILMNTVKNSEGRLECVVVDKTF